MATERQSAHSSTVRTWISRAFP